MRVLWSIINSCLKIEKLKLLGTTATNCQCSINYQVCFQQYSMPNKMDIVGKYHLFGSLFIMLVSSSINFPGLICKSGAYIWNGYVEGFLEQFSK